MITETSFENKVSVFNIQGPRRNIYTPWCFCCGTYNHKGKRMPKQFKKTLRDHRRGKSNMKKRK